MQAQLFLLFIDCASVVLAEINPCQDQYPRAFPLVSRSLMVSDLTWLVFISSYF